MTFLCEERFVQEAKRAVRIARRQLEQYIENRVEFRTSLVPLPYEPDAPGIVRRMCEASAKVGVGPMASVAGTIAIESLNAILAAGASEAVVDNGGDIALFIRKPIRVGLYAGSSTIQNLAFEIQPRKEIVGICTSSGTVGPSFSYGNCDAAVVIAEDPVLADAAATALGNRISADSDVQGAFAVFDHLDEIEGAVAILGSRIGLYGTLPRLVQAKVHRGLITKGR